MFRQKQNLIIYFSLCITASIIYFMCNISCPFFTLLGFPCPTCGVTHALCALLEGNFKAYIHYHALAPFLIIAIFFTVFTNTMQNSKLKKRLQILVLIILALNTIYYFLRLYNGFK